MNEESMYGFLGLRKEHERVEQDRAAPETKRKRKLLLWM
jgi:hypothetical protein